LATRSMQTASATLEPPNLCTRQRSTDLVLLLVVAAIRVAQPSTVSLQCSKGDGKQ
jgi:hypothetical protein